jgi:hypothetical protein
LWHPTPGTRKRHATSYGSQFKYNAEMTAIMPQGEKTTGRWHKSGRTEQSGYQFKKHRTPACKNPVKHLCLDQQEEIDQTSTRKALKKITNAIKKTHNYRTRQEINEHIFGTIKDNGVTITLI